MIRRCGRSERGNMEVIRMRGSSTGKTGEIYAGTGANGKMGDDTTGGKN